MTTILGIDPSLTSTGLVVLSGTGETLHHEAIKTKPNRHVADGGIVLRLSYISDRVLSVCRRFAPPILIVIEQPVSYGGHGRSAMEIAGLFYVLRYRLEIGDSVPKGQLWIVTPARLKQFAAGKGNAKKPVVAAAVKERWGMEFKTTDETDAYVLARIGLKGLRDNFGEAA